MPDAHTADCNVRDGRESSPNLSEAFIEGMLRAGAHVLDAGMGPTPLCYFTSRITWMPMAA